MKDTIRFLVFWVGTKCTLHCRDCCNLIPYLQQRSFDVDKIMDNLRYITKDITVETLQIQGGEPFTHKEIHKIIQGCAENKNINKIEIATNGTILPNKQTIDILKKYSEKVVVRFSDYECTQKKRTKIENELIKESINVQNYEFMFSTGDWFDLGRVDKEKETNFDKVIDIYKNCPNKSCWTLAEDYFAGCGRMISYLALKENEAIEGNNIIDINKLKQEKKAFIDEYQKFENRYNNYNEPSELCGYCQKNDKLIPAGIQLNKDEINIYLGISRS